MNEIRDAMGFYDFDWKDPAGHYAEKPWTPPAEPVPVRFVLFEQGNDEIGWTAVGVAVYSRWGYQSASKIDGLQCDRLELQNYEAMRDAGHDLRKIDPAYVTRLQLLAWIDRLKHYGDLELAREYPLQLKRIGNQVIRISPLLDARENGKNLRPDWQSLVESHL